MLHLSQMLPPRSPAPSAIGVENIFEGNTSLTLVGRNYGHLGLYQPPAKSSVNFLALSGLVVGLDP